jgi:cation diffusion facilitator CzcD-associated flavoprotein CzcO
VTVPGLQTSIPAEAVFARWLDRFHAAVEARDSQAVGQLFVDGGYWKDILSFTWGYRTVHGRAQIRRRWEATQDDVLPTAVRPSSGRTAPRAMRRSARQVVEGYFDFDTKFGRGTGFARLLPDGPDSVDAKAWFALTTLQELHGLEEQTGERRPTGVRYSTTFSGENWLDERRRAVEYTDAPPEVLVVGGGQAGLILAARLKQMGIDCLVVEKGARIGDNWRARYHSLTLHNEVWANNMPYLPFPSTWPTFVPKDKLAGWLESYAEFMELNVWTSAELVGARYDEKARQWHATIRRGGDLRELRVPQLVLATGGASGVPHLPDQPGLSSFSGELIHSSAFTTGAPYRGRRAIVFGTGNSGHDVAQDLYGNGVDVTLVQRSPTCVVSLVPSGTMVYALYSEGPPADDIDLIMAATPYPIFLESSQWLTKKTCAVDKELLDGLHAVGFETDFEPDGTGFYMKYLRHGGGYYINVGCSELIADRKIGLVHARDIDTFTEAGLRLTDGSSVDADLVVFATGYENQQEGVRRLLGSEIADRVGPIWGHDDNYVMRNMWQRTAQPALWIMGGSLIDCRLYSKFLALQIAADLRDVM